MPQEKAIFDLLHQYKELVGNNSRCKALDLYGLNPYDLAVSTEQGDRKALRSVAITLLKGDGVRKDVENATELFYRLQTSHTGEEDLVSQYYYSKILCTRDDYSRGLKLNEELMQKGYAPAFVLRGNLYERGLCGLEVSIEKANEHYFQAYKKNHIQGGLLFAKILLKEGRPTDKVKAIYVFIKISCISIFSKSAQPSAECDTL